MESLSFGKSTGYVNQALKSGECPDKYKPAKTVFSITGGETRGKMDSFPSKNQLGHDATCFEETYGSAIISKHAPENALVRKVEWAT